jgi:CBS-domain-containing membrane protein
MLVRDVMTDYVVAASMETTLKSVMRAMKVHRVRHLPVVGESAIVGIISERELTSAASMAARFGAGRQEYEDYLESSVQDFLQTRFTADSDVVIARPGESLSTALDRLVDQRLSALPVVDASGRLVGMLSYIDVLIALRGLLKQRTKSERFPEAGSHVVVVGD